MIIGIREANVLICTAVKAFAAKSKGTDDFISALLLFRYGSWRLIASEGKCRLELSVIFSISASASEAR